jgi:hypothetical protein
MYLAYPMECQLLISLFHPQWLLDGPVVLRRRWKMTWDKESLPLSCQLTPEDWNRFRGRGTEMVKSTALAVVHMLEGLPPGDAESFADAFRETTERLTARQAATRFLA